MGCGTSTTQNIHFASVPLKPAPVEAREPCVGVPIAASVDETIEAINAACKARGLGNVFSCKLVSWDDAQRCESAGQLSCLGPNITDTRLFEKGGRQLYTLRSDNWNEILGKVPAGDIVLLAGDNTVTLQSFLENLGRYGSYAGLDPDLDLSRPDLDSEVSIRFQTVFLPVEDEAVATIEFAAQTYNYHTRDNTNPQNLILLASSQGTAVQADGTGPTMVYHHREAGGVIHRHWLEAERSTKGVGGHQEESDAEAAAAAVRGKATATPIGISEMGRRFNVLMTVQVPLQQQEARRPPRALEKKSRAKLEKKSGARMERKSRCKAPRKSRGGADAEEEEKESGISNAARVSIGSEVDTWPGLRIPAPARHPEQHITVTVVTYYTVAGGVPSADDVEAAVCDLKALYSACGWSGQLADAEAAFAKAH